MTHPPTGYPTPDPFTLLAQALHDAQFPGLGLDSALELRHTGQGHEVVLTLQVPAATGFAQLIGYGLTHARHCLAGDR